MTGDGKGWARGYRHESLTCAICGRRRGEHLPYSRTGLEYCPTRTGETFVPVVAVHKAD